VLVGALRQCVPTRGDIFTGTRRGMTGAKQWRRREQQKKRKGDRKIFAHGFVPRWCLVHTLPESVLNLVRIGEHVRTIIHRAPFTN
jgi:hypothetical protein